MICQEIKCLDYSTDDGEPAWCNRAGCPSVVAIDKCPKLLGVKTKMNGRAPELPDAKRKGKNK